MLLLFQNAQNITLTMPSFCRKSKNVKNITSFANISGTRGPTKKMMAYMESATPILGGNALIESHFGKITP